MRCTRWVAAVVCSAALGLSPAQADVRLPGLIGDNMVLQQGMPAPLWGWADPGEEVTVTLGAQKAAAKADAAGRWRVTLGPLEAGGPHKLLVAGRNTIELTNVLVGEVWVCSGQSNMAMSVAGSRNASAEIAAADFPHIRLFSVPLVASASALDNVAGAWSVCSPKTVGGFSAVGYFFGRELHKARQVPIGLIHTSWGGTPAEAWTSYEGLSAHEALRPLAVSWVRHLIGYARVVEELAPKLGPWRLQAEKALASDQPVPPVPARVLPTGVSAHTPTALFNGMIAPVIPYAIRGVIWYQGESNAGRAAQYRTLFPALIQDWRRHWGQGDFPFLFVQLCNYMAVNPQPKESHWAELREAQTLALKLPKTGMAVTIDIGEASDIHPKNKQDVGRRLALAARAIAYGEKLVYSGPLYEGFTVEGDRVRVRFRHVGGGLVPGAQAPTDCPAAGTEACCGGRRCVPLRGFAVAGEDRRFVWAEAVIDGDTVVVHSPEVPQPRAVRYAWANNPVCNLYNKEGLPASPFRTDGPETEPPTPATRPAGR